MFGQAGASARAAEASFNRSRGALGRFGNQAQASSGKLSAFGNVAANAFTAVGVAAAAAAAVGIKAAADIRQALGQIAVQSGKTIDQMDRRFSGIAFRISERTGMSVVDALGVVREVGGVIKDPVELQKALVGDARSGGLIDLAFVLRQAKVATADPAHIARSVITLDHILNAYTQAAMAQVNEKLYRAAVGSHMELEPLITQIGYFGEQYRLAAGGSPAAIQDILKLGELGYWGVGRGKWGSGFGQILRQINRLPKQSVAPMEALGILDARGGLSATTQNERGEFTPMAMIAQVIARTAGMTPMARQRLINKAFPANAARILAEATSPKTQKFLARLEASQGNMQPLMSAEATLLDNLNSQTERLANNFKNLSAVLEKPFVQDLTRWAGGAADKLGQWTEWARKHPHEAKVAGTALNVAAVAGIAALLWRSHLFVSAVIGRHGITPRFYERLGTHYGAGRSAGVGVGSRMLRGGRGALGWLLEAINPFRGAGAAARGTGSFLSDLPRMLGGGPMFWHNTGILRAAEMARGAIGRVGSVLGFAAQHAGFLAGILGRVALRFLGIVGWVSLATDALRFFHDHPKDIGVWIGRVIGFIRWTLIPKTQEALWGLVRVFGEAIGGMLKSIWWALTHIPDLIKDTGTALRAIQKQVDDMKPHDTGGKPVPGNVKHPAHPRDHRVKTRDVVVNGPLVGTVVLPKGTSRQHADTMLRHIRVAVRRAGDYGTSPVNSSGHEYGQPAFAR